MRDLNRTINVLIIEDCEDDREFYRRALSRTGSDQFTVIEADLGAEGITIIQSQQVDCVLLDYNLPDTDGLEVLESIVELMPNAVPPVILLTGAGSERIAVEAMKAGAHDYLVKGQIRPDDLQIAITNALKHVELERELAVAYAQLEKKNARLNEMTDTALRFVDDVAHEFRTPLAVIHEFTALINDGIAGPITDQQKEFLSYTSSATRDLAQMVDDFLDSSRLKHHALRIDRVAHRVEDILEPVRPLLKSRAQSKNISICERIEGEVPNVFGDIEKAGRTLVNLAVNAIKFSPEGSSIDIFVKPEGSFVTIGVTDHGAGIGPEELKSISQRFKQASDGAKNKVKGFGLGLNIASELSWLNLGQLNVTSKPDEGSTFSFTLPVVDTLSIIDQHQQSIINRDPDAELTVLHVVPMTLDANIEELRTFLSSICHPMDLVLTTATGQSVLLIGITSEPQGWMNRLQSNHKAAAESDACPGPFSAQWCGTFHRDQFKSELQSCITTRLSEARVCA